MLSSFRFKKCIEEATRHSKCEHVDLCGFSNAILEHIFAMPQEERGMVDYIVYSHSTETQEGLHDRMARVNITKNGHRYYFYVFAESSTESPRSWKVIGRSVFMEMPLSLPSFETEMTLFE